MLRRVLSAAVALSVSVLLWVATAPEWPEPRDRYEAFPPVTLHRAPWLRALPHIEAMTLPGHVYLRDPEPRPYTLPHEYAHARQWSRYGTLAFARAYLRDRSGMEREASREAWTTCDSIPDIVPASICGGVR